MLKVFVGVLMIVAGVTATELCSEPIHRVCRDDDSPKRFPETAEELQDFCNFALGFFRCGVKYTEKCDPSDEHGLRGYLTAFEDVCNEDSLLYAGCKTRVHCWNAQLVNFQQWTPRSHADISETVVDNLQCFNELRMKGPIEECHTPSLSPSVETLQKYAEALLEEGHSVFSDDESEVNHTLVCLQNLQEMACYATTLEDKCGTIAMDTFVEIAQKFSHVGFCGETYHYLPTVLRVYKLQQEEANEIAEVFKKRK